MQGIEYELEKSREIHHTPESQSWMVKVLMRFGITDETTANFILGGVVGVLFGIAIFLYAGVIGGDINIPPDSLGPR